MKARCPRCQAGYEVKLDAVLAAEGLARCGHCNCLFDVVAEAPVSYAAPEALERTLILFPDHTAAQRSSAASGEMPLPFDVPDDLPPLRPTPQAALDINDTLKDERPRRHLAYLLFVSLLVAAFAAQLAWQYRLDLLHRFPQLESICSYLPCRPETVDQPERYRVIERAMRPTPNTPGSLTLSVSIRNDADYRQALPDLELSLLDTRGGVLLRRRLSPSDYLFPPPPEDRMVAPGEVLAIAIDFADPGPSATGFTIDFRSSKRAEKTTLR